MCLESDPSPYSKPVAASRKYHLGIGTSNFAHHTDLSVWYFSELMVSLNSEDFPTTAGSVG